MFAHAMTSSSANISVEFVVMAITTRDGPSHVLDQVIQECILSDQLFVPIASEDSVSGVLHSRHDSGTIRMTDLNLEMGMESDLELDMELDLGLDDGEEEKEGQTAKRQVKPVTSVPSKPSRSASTAGFAKAAFRSKDPPGESSDVVDYSNMLDKGTALVRALVRNPAQHMRTAAVPRESVHGMAYMSTTGVSYAMDLDVVGAGSGFTVDLSLQKDTTGLF